MEIFLVEAVNDKILTMPNVWILTNGHQGNTTQAVGLAKSLGWDFKIKELYFVKWVKIRQFCIVARMIPFLGLDHKNCEKLQPPWPDIVIGVGRSIAPVTRWIGRKSGGKTITIHIGRGGGPLANRYHAVITPVYCQMAPDVRRYETLLPLNPISQKQISKAKSEWPGIFADMPRPVVVFLVGGDAPQYQLNAEYAENMVKNVMEWAEKSAGSVMAVTSRRTNKSVIAILKSVLKKPHRVHCWHQHEKENPYYAFLAKADVLVVTGESESMLAETASTDKPLYIYPVPKINSSNFGKQFKEYCTKRAYSHFMHKSGRNFLTRCIDGAFSWFMLFIGLVPQRDIDRLHEALYSSGRAHPFGSPLNTGVYEPVYEAPDVSRWIKSVITEYSSCLKNSSFSHDV